VTRIGRKPDQRPHVRQAVPVLGLSLERGTEDVPDDGCFHVLLNGTVIFTSASEKNALREYRGIRNRLLPPASGSFNVREALGREAAEMEVRRFLADSSRAKRAKALKKGGKGGSGGVGSG
jgi:hypothetical protein